MQDPHVVSLTYTLLVPADEIYQGVSPVDSGQPAFHARLEEGKLNLTMNAHFASVDDARAQVSSFLSAWEMDAFLNGRKIEFSFLEGEVIDRNPPAVRGNVLECSVGAFVISSAEARLTVHRKIYPAPPTWNEVSPVAKRLYGRFVTLMEGRESITAHVAIEITSNAIAVLLRLRE